MARVAALSRILLAFCLRSADAVREERVTFSCPSECQECCTLPWAAGLGTSGEQFKCVLKDSKALPKGRSCTEKEKRSVWTYFSGQWKTTCDFTPDEKASSAWEGLEPKCSKEAWCCCNQDDEWTENVCMGMGTETPHVLAISPKSGVEERYERVAQQYDNTDSACVPEPGGVPEGVPYQENPNGDLTSTGCCLKSEPKTHSFNKRCGLALCGAHKKWTACTSWQRLYRCSGDGGHTQTGQMYRRVPRRRGLCLGDESTPERLMHTYGAAAGSELAAAFKGLKLQDGQCPAKYDNWAGERPCKCDVDCRDKEERFRFQGE